MDELSNFARTRKSNTIAFFNEYGQVLFLEGVSERVDLMARSRAPTSGNRKPYGYHLPRSVRPLRATSRKVTGWPISELNTE
jgi:hypothetical protein